MTAVAKTVRAAVLAAAAVAVLVMAGAVLQARANGGRVGRNVSMAGRPVGGMRPAAVHRVVRDVADDYARATVEIRAPGGGLTATGAELGVRVKAEETVRDALRLGKGGTVLGRAWRETWALLHSRSTPVHLAVDPRATYDVVTSRDRGPRAAPVEPSVTARGDRLVAVEGKPGRGISPASVSAALERVKSGRSPLVARVGRGPVEPRFQLADAQRLLAQAEDMTASPLRVAAGDVTAQVPPSTLRKWLRAYPAETSLAIGIDEATTTEDLNQVLAEATTDPVSAGFVVAGDRVDITPSRAGKACCAPEAAAMVAAALGDRPDGPVVIPLRTIEPRRTTEDARRLGVQRPVASFTTNHNGGEPRVANIHRIADMVRGTLIGPGDSFSVNSHVGPRTPERGFVEAPVIDEKNTFSTSPGGGVSQFATTLFNAAFFAGLEFGEYSAHSLYIPRYPYGREATLSYPHPDLIVRNPSPYGVLIWTAYTDTSITVTIYSTKWVEADQTGQTKTERPAKPGPERDPAKPPPGPCISVTTERTRRFVSDGRTAVDRFYALYRPEEGTECPR